MYKIDGVERRGCFVGPWVAQAAREPAHRHKPLAQSKIGVGKRDRLGPNCKYDLT